MRKYDTDAGLLVNLHRPVQTRSDARWHLPATAAWLANTVELADLPDIVTAEALPIPPTPLLLLIAPLCAIAAARILLWDYKVRHCNIICKNLC